MKQVFANLCGKSRVSGLVLLVSMIISGFSGVALCAEMLGEEEIARLQEKTFDSRRNTAIEFSASVTNTSKWAQPTRKYTFTVHCGLNEIKEIRGKKFSQRLSGPVEIRILDCDNKVVVSARKALEKMCAT